MAFKSYPNITWLAFEMELLRNIYAYTHSYFDN